MTTEYDTEIVLHDQDSAKYSTQTIRQRQGRQVISSLTTSSSSEDITPLANKALLWGRVYYQAKGIEQVLVFGSLAVHILSGASRLLIRTIWASKQYLANRNSRTVVVEEHEGVTRTIIRETKVTSSAPSSSTGASPGTFPYNRFAAWFLAPVVLGHAFTCRIFPELQLQDSAIIDYSFVTFHHRTQNAGFVYALLIAPLLYHVYSDGFTAINAILPKGSNLRYKAKDLIQNRSLRAVASGVTTLVGLVGLYRIVTDPSSIPWQHVYAKLL
ncbi:hypothetical protein BGZ94_009622 [Podila epigama]|nr:hypothetical protein BGZ94_009622 [Podila epigama]